MPVPTSTLIQPGGGDGVPVAAADSAPTELNSNIWIAAGEGDLASVQHLLETNADLTPTSPDDFSYTAVHAAASYGQLEVLEYLLSHPKAALYKPPPSPMGTPPPQGAANVQDSDGDTPLFVCEAVEAAKLLIEKYGADPKHRNLDGKTAAQSAYENDALEVAEYLRSLTGEPEPTDEDEEDDEGYGEEEDEGEEAGGDEGADDDEDADEADKQPQEEPGTAGRTPATGSEVPDTGKRD
ncbi:hypothetical protein V8E36_000423 [Tilletia maclaganii]